MTKGEVFQSKFLAKEDVPNPVVATIANVKYETIKGKGRDEQKAVMEFAGNLKPMILNKGNWTRVEVLYGPESDEWLGKKIEIYVDPTVEFGGDIVGGLRLREPSKNGKAANYHETPLASVWTFDQAVAAVKEVGISKEQLIEALKKEGSAKWKADRDTPMVRRLIE